MACFKARVFSRAAPCGQFGVYIAEDGGDGGLFFNWGQRDWKMSIIVAVDARLVPLRK